MDPTRAFVKDVKRVVVKVGTAVVTRADGGLALGRLGALCEQLKDLNTRGFEVILVTSGAVGVGRQRLRYRKLLNSSFADLQTPQAELDGKECAAVGQSGLMSLYDALFTQLDVTSSQLLVTDRDFGDINFRMQLCETVKSLLKFHVIPIFNENDAISTRKAPYEDSSGIFWDNDSLAALLALELKADLLILLSDVDGLYDGPPSEPQSKLIHTYIKEKHQGEVTFGDKSRVGRGGMTAKVKAAVYAASVGVPVIITSGYATDNIIKVVQGEHIGTLFHKDAHLWAPVKEVDSRDMAVAAREWDGVVASLLLHLGHFALPSEDRKKILLQVADALETNESLIQEENDADVAAAKKAGLAKSVRVLAEMEEPIGRVLARTEIASLAIRSGNGLLLKGGKEAKRSNAVLHKVITEAIPETVGSRLIGLVTSREEIPDLLKLDDVIDLVIPRGSNKLVSQIKESTKIPVLGHSDGICHVYVDKSANLDMAKRVVLDAKVDYPAACNAMETLLVHKDLLASGSLNELVEELRTAGITLYGGPKVSTSLKLMETRTFHHEYNSMACTIEIVDDVYAVIDHIHCHGRHANISLSPPLLCLLFKWKKQSAHTDCIVTEDHEVAEIFLHQIDSAAVFHNVSTRFCDGARFGLGAEVGISTSRIHARGPVGVEGLLTTRWIMRGNGQVVDGDKGVVYTHKTLPLQA
ncbi:hypothetical protein C5167_000841 [Papaver somniferum]|uniref:Delta-1-pyrroline-5-carboxylate synthase n=1 Tax=Papaver somniferum TaxID=3469 RepID=A0A4Y7KTM7_PAPSO|nr:hypothetical protein C5167_000841 [Papaver somniferum]